MWLEDLSANHLKTKVAVSNKICKMGYKTVFSQNVAIPYSVPAVVQEVPANAGGKWTGIVNAQKGKCSNVIVGIRDPCLKCGSEDQELHFEGPFSSDLMLC